MNYSPIRRKYMAERVCDECAKKRDISGGKTCEKGHFICKDCVYSGVIFIDEKKACPICKRPLR
jgi:rubrerythrin